MQSNETNARRDRAPSKRARSTAARTWSILAIAAIGATVTAISASSIASPAPLEGAGGARVLGPTMSVGTRSNDASASGGEIGLAGSSSVGVTVASGSSSGSGTTSVGQSVGVGGLVDGGVP